MVKKSLHSVIIPETVYPKPTKEELAAAYLLLEYFKTDIEFIPRGNISTPDFLINGVKWELKSPTGIGKYNIQHLLHHAVKQSLNIIVDARYSKMHIARIKNELKLHSTTTSKCVKRLLLIDKQRNIIVIK